MGRLPATSHRARSHVSIALAMVVASAAAAQAQAWVPPAGVGAVTVAVQNLEYTGHRVTDGTFFPVGMSVHNLIEIEGDYAITDRLSVTASVPFVFAKYLDPNPLPPFVPFLPVDDCRCWQAARLPAGAGFAAARPLPGGLEPRARRARAGRVPVPVP